MRKLLLYYWGMFSKVYSVKGKVQSNMKKDAAIWLNREKKEKDMDVLEYVLSIYGKCTGNLPHTNCLLEEEQGGWRTG